MNWPKLTGGSGRNGGDGGGDGAGGIGVYGKVRSQADFLRSNAGEFSQAGLDRWIQEGLEILRTEGTSLPQQPTAFFLSGSDFHHTFVGVFAPSSDAAGRPFPLAVFGRYPCRGLTETFPSLVADCAPFIEAAGALLATGGDLSGPELVQRAESLAQSLPPAGGRADAAFERAGETAQSVTAELGGSPLALAYALRTFVTACDQAAKTGPDGRGGVITVDAPAPDAGARALWLELARRRLHWRDAVPSLLWTGGTAGRLLLTLGPPSPAALSFLANPRHRAARFWPLRTEVAAALDQAMKALTPEQRRLVENPRVSLGELVAGFA